MVTRRPRIGDILLRRGVVNERQLAAALDRQRQWGTPLGRTLVDLRICSAADVLAALSEQTGVPLVDLDTEPVEPEAVALVSQKVAEGHQLVPLRLEGKKKEVLVVAIAAPAKLASLDAVQAVSRKSRVAPFLALDAAIDRAIGRLYRGHVDSRGDGGAAEYVPLERELQLEINQEPESEGGSVWIYGWSTEAGQAMLKLLEVEGISARVAKPEEVLSSHPTDVIVSPLPAMETLVPRGQKSPGQLIVAVKSPEGDLLRAQSLGARGYVATPVDKDLLLRAIRRCRRS